MGKVRPWHKREGYGHHPLGKCQVRSLVSWFYSRKLGLAHLFFLSLRTVVRFRHAETFIMCVENFRRRKKSTHVRWMDLSCRGDPTWILGEKFALPPNTLLHSFSPSPPGCVGRNDTSTPTTPTIASVFEHLRQRSNNAANNHVNIPKSNWKLFAFSFVIVNWFVVAHARPEAAITRPTERKSSPVQSFPVCFISFHHMVQ